MSNENKSAAHLEMLNEVQIY